MKGAKGMVRFLVGGPTVRTLAATVVRKRKDETVDVVAQDGSRKLEIGGCQIGGDRMPCFLPEVAKKAEEPKGEAGEGGETGSGETKSSETKEPSGKK